MNESLKSSLNLLIKKEKYKIWFYYVEDNNIINSKDINIGMIRYLSESDLHNNYNNIVCGDGIYGELSKHITSTYEYYRNELRNVKFFDKTLIFPYEFCNEYRNHFIDILKLFHLPIFVFTDIPDEEPISYIHWYINHFIKEQGISVSKFKFDFDCSDTKYIYEKYKDSTYDKESGEELYKEFSNTTKAIYYYPKEMIRDTLKILTEHDIDFECNLVCIDVLFNRKTRRISGSNIVKIYKQICKYIKSCDVASIILDYLY